MRGDQIVSTAQRKFEKFRGHLSANKMMTRISRIGSAVTVTEIAGDRVRAATFQFRT
jgi:hypothetical protein